MVFDTYQKIFNERGDAYHAAMEFSPNSRDREFELIINQADLKSGQILCDMPSGGGYLQNYIDDIDIELVLIEPSREFYDRISLSSGNSAYLCELDKLPLDTKSLDAIISLAGLHHANYKLQIFKEMYRVLKQGGRLCIADVREGSSVDDFLNIFIDRYNSSGHEGDFINKDFYKLIEMAGFDIILKKPICYSWDFSSKEAMAKYCKLLFGVDKANEDEVLDGIEKYLGYEEIDNRCHLNWELEFITGLK